MNFWKRIFGNHKQTSSVNDELAKFSKDELRSAALTLIWPLPDVHDSFWGGTLEEAINAQKQCIILREKYKNYEPKRMRREILSWISYAEGEIARNKADIISQNSKKHMQRYKNKREIEQTKTNEILQILDKREK